MTRRFVERRESIALPVETDAGTTFGREDKRVVAAELTLRARDPEPPKRIVTVHTRDGWAYRWQRFGLDEPLVQLDRERADGTRKGKTRANMPDSIEEFVEAVENREIVPEYADELEAERAIHSSSSDPQAVADGGKSIQRPNNERTDR